MSVARNGHRSRAMSTEIAIIVRYQYICRQRVYSTCCETNVIMLASGVTTYDVFDHRLGRGHDPRASLKWPPKRWADRAEILHGFWDIHCATLRKKVGRLRSGHGAMTS